jgi:cell division protein ZapA (FtsZ GTPase activity inhibitor)
MNEIKKRTVTIFGELYTIVSDEPEEFVSRAVEHVNNITHAIAQKAGSQDQKKVALLSALHIALELQKNNVRLGLLEEREKRILASVDQSLSQL